MKRFLFALVIGFLLVPGVVLASTILNVNTGMEVDNNSDNWPDGWSLGGDQNGSGITTTNPHAGSNALNLVSDGDLIQESLYDKCLSAACQSSNQTLEACAWMRTDYTEVALKWVQVLVYNGTTAVGEAHDIFPSGSHGWTQKCASVYVAGSTQRSTSEFSGAAMGTIQPPS